MKNLIIRSLIVKLSEISLKSTNNSIFWESNVLEFDEF